MKPLKLNKKSYKTIIGIMTGTSLDGVDVLIVKIKGAGAGISYKNIAFEVYPIPAALRVSMREIMRLKTAGLETLCSLNYEIAALYESCVKKICVKNRLNLSEIDLIAISGQTFYHIPGRATMQLGDGSFLAARTGVNVAWNFRASDIAAGGQGAPLVPYLDYVLFSKYKKDIITLNIGGISNLTHIPASGDFDDITAFDCGPGNMIIDKMTFEYSGGKKKYDRDARIAAGGKISNELLKLMSSHEYLALAPPKSTGRETFGDEYTRGIIDYCTKKNIAFNDMIRTATEFSSFCIINGIEKHLLKKIKNGRKNTNGGETFLVCAGGGARNPIIFGGIKERLAGFGIKTVKSEEFGIDSKSKEALLMAVLANDTLYGIPSNVPSATGAKKNVITATMSFQQNA